MDKISRLTEIGNKYNTDKGTVAYEKHGYTEEYSKYIPEKGYYELLEIGVYKGDSIKMWTEYNPDMYVIGLDIDLNCLNYIPQTGWGYEILIGDASKKEFIDSLFSGKVGETFPDFIIDDGSHRYEDILASFKLLYPKLKPGGYYFIEDLHAGQSRREELIFKLAEYLVDSDVEIRGKLTCNNKLLILKK